ncbi:MAG: RnfABCDGE type electron transport complex subunit G [Halanaerobiales bacterium]
MKNRMSILIITLTIIGIISAVSLAFVYEWTKPHIKEHEMKARESAVFEVLPGAQEYKVEEKEGTTFYEGFNENGNRIGVAVIEKGSGFQGEIRMMVGTDPDTEKINGIKILEHQETPGLGARITEDEYKNNYVDKPFGKYSVVKQSTDNPSEVEAISGATISSEKVAEITEKAINKIKTNYGSGS